MRKQMLVAIALGFVLVACGREGGDLSQLTETTATPRATATAEATTTPAASATPTAPPAATEAPGATQAPGGEAPPAAEGQVNRPKAGRYVYDISGESTSPFGSQQFPEGARQTTQITRSGDVNTDETTNSGEAGRTVARTRWESSKVSLLSFTAERAGQTFSCTFNPPVEIIHIPMKAETFPTQNLSGQGNACGGTLSITVEGKEDVKDATGRTWSTWRIKVRQEVKNDQLNAVTDETRWFSPDLGAQIRAQSNQSGSFSGASFSSKTTSVLRSHP